MAESTPFARCVRALVRSIPRGKVASYGQVARMLATLGAPAALALS